MTEARSALEQRLFIRADAVLQETLANALKPLSQLGSALSAAMAVESGKADTIHPHPVIGELTYQYEGQEYTKTIALDALPGLLLPILVERYRDVHRGAMAEDFVNAVLGHDAEMQTLLREFLGEEAGHADTPD